MENAGAKRKQSKMGGKAEEAGGQCKWRRQEAGGAWWGERAARQGGGGRQRQAGARAGSACRATARLCHPADAHHVAVSVERTGTVHCTSPREAARGVAITVGVRCRKEWLATRSAVRARVVYRPCFFTRAGEKMPPQAVLVFAVAEEEKAVRPREKHVCRHDGMSPPTPTW